ncbi:MAG: SPOR domain-containing protein [Flavobacteriales bacterium]|nr:SPOR domain-containing protein [Flavobacteriales bacterium]MCX7767903.1 SPOR domain-containing protein [Flavobacteriales bacterium]MDW8409307.1 SPOR domain-containing protein [Flavobacteriales bacterium]
MKALGFGGWFLFGLLIAVQAQTPYQSDGAGRVVFLEDSATLKAVKKIENGEISQKGYRVQVFSESGSGSKSRAMKVRAEVSEKFSGLPVYVTYEAPNFKVRVGDFQTFLEAAALCEKARTFYPSSYVVEDKIWVKAPRSLRE